MEPEIKIPKRQIRQLIHDSEKSAAAVNLVYVSDTQPGIRRIRIGARFTYRYNNLTVRDKDELARIKSLVIPPAWENVWICKLPNGHIQVTGNDVRRRKQYRYHTLWNSLRNQTKFFHMFEFGLELPKIRCRAEQDLALPGMPAEKVLATVVSLMERTNIRIGSSGYEKLYGSFGLTTLKDRHVEIEGAEMKFLFKGKKGVTHRISIRSKRLAAIVKKSKEIPGKELFQYIDENGTRHGIDSGMVNRYLENICGKGFTAKDFRTWNGSVQALVSLRGLDCADESDAVRKKNIVAALDEVSRHLGNTRTVCKKYYVHPVILSLYESRGLEKYRQDGRKPENGPFAGLTDEERLLMDILEKEGYAVR